MAGSTYSPLKIELIPTGAQVGVWGATTNVNLGTAIEQALVGRAVLDTADFTANVATLVLVDSNAPQDARAFSLMVTATLTAAGTVNVPAINKPYLVFNNSVGGFAITIKVAGQPGVSVPAGRKAFVYNDGVDVSAAIDYFVSLTVGTLNAGSLALTTPLPATQGGTGNSTYAYGDILYKDVSNTVLGRLNTGVISSGYILTIGPFDGVGCIPRYVDPQSITVGAATVVNNFAGGSAFRIPYQTAPNFTTFTPAPVTAGSFLQFTGTGYTWNTAIGSGSVTLVNGSGGTTGMTLTGGPITTTGTLTLGGVLEKDNGGTGLSGGVATGAIMVWGTGPTTMSSLAPSTPNEILVSDGTNWVRTPKAQIGVSTGRVYYMAQF